LKERDGRTAHIIQDLNEELAMAQREGRRRLEEIHSLNADFERKEYMLKQKEAGMEEAQQEFLVLIGEEEAKCRNQALICT